MVARKGNLKTIHLLYEDMKVYDDKLSIQSFQQDSIEMFFWMIMVLGKTDFGIMVIGKMSFKKIGFWNSLGFPTSFQLISKKFLLTVQKENPKLKKNTFLKELTAWYPHQAYDKIVQIMTSMKQIIYTAANWSQQAVINVIIKN